MASPQDIVILGSARTPIGSFLGGLKTVPAVELGGTVLRAAINRAGLEPSHVDQVNMGCVLPAGVGQAPARQATLRAGCPSSTGAVTLNKVCGSGMRAVMMAANDLRCGDFDVVAAGGMENMSQVPYVVRAREGLRLGHRELVDTLIHDGLWDPYNDFHMGNCAEICADHYSIGREDQDAFALDSYQRARQAVESGHFAAEIAPVEVTDRKGRQQTFDRDEDPFRVDLSRAGDLRPAFQSEGTVTAANASNLNDGAAALVLTTRAKARELGVSPRFRVRAHTSTAQDPAWFTTAPIAAIKKVLQRADVTTAEIDLFEINEAFAVVVLACIKELELDRERVNVHGGAVALGHPIGASGARILVTLLHAMEEREARLGCAAICIGGGEATAIVVERES